MEVTGIRHGGVRHSLHILLKSLIDYAGLFPPSGLGMADAVANYSRYRISPDAWALGRFIVPAARLTEFEQFFVPGREPWHLSALIGQNATEDIARIVEFNSRHRQNAVVDTVEAKPAGRSEVESLRHQIPESIIVYFEVPIGEDPADLVNAVAAAHSRAKIRTGGLTQEMFPPENQILRFLQACIAASVPFKATAGLHHPLRCVRPLTYEKDSPTGTMHGFLNVFLAAAFLLDGMSVAELEQLLTESEGSKFVFEEGAVTWRGHRLSQSRLLESRALAASFGSCSFDEPMGDLRNLNLI
ncbi:MAG TPA: hypothetical protein VF135_09870 [Terriglobales bacterium]